MEWTIERDDKWHHTLTIYMADHAAPDIKLFIPGDIHHDSPYCARVKLHEHMKRAKDEGAFIVSIGDQFCAMEGRYDPRRSREGIRPEYNTADYIDQIVRGFCEDLAPYKDRWVVMGYGNHETSIRKNNDTDLVERACERWRMMGGKTIATDYCGFLRVRIVWPNSDDQKRTETWHMYYHHGFGGGAPVTDGIIDLKRHHAFVEGVDLIVMGHKHTYLHTTQSVMKPTKGGRVDNRDVHLLRVDSYKDSNDPNSWAASKGFKPVTFGGALITIGRTYVKRGVKRLSTTVTKWD